MSGRQGLLAAGGRRGGDGHLAWAAARWAAPAGAAPAGGGKATRHSGFPARRMQGRRSRHPAEAAGWPSPRQVTKRRSPGRGDADHSQRSPISTTTTPVPGHLAALPTTRNNPPLMPVGVATRFSSQRVPSSRARMTSRRTRELNSPPPRSGGEASSATNRMRETARRREEHASQRPAQNTDGDRRAPSRR